MGDRVVGKRRESWVRSDRQSLVEHSDRVAMLGGSVVALLTAVLAMQCAQNRDGAWRARAGLRALAVARAEAHTGGVGYAPARGRLLVRRLLLRLAVGAGPRPTRELRPRRVAPVAAAAQLRADYVVCNLSQ